MKKKMCIGAGLFVVAMFLLTTVPVNATIVPEMQTERISIQATQTPYVGDETYSFPAQLPPGTSSLSCITKRHAGIFNPWSGQILIYDVGFSMWSMRLRDGPTHDLNFCGTLTVKEHKDSVAQNTPYPIQISWTGWVLGGFDIYRAGTYIFPQDFYTATIHGIIYKDMGTFEYKTRDLYGYNYIVENGFFPGVLSSELTAELLVE